MKPARITTVVIVALVALRLGCGWLFYREGSKKLDSGTFASEHFLRDAKGPLAGMYLGMVPDPYGDIRQTYDYAEEEWDYYYNDAANHFRFNEEHIKEAEGAYRRALAKLKFYLDSTSEERRKNLLEAQRIETALKDDPTVAISYRSNWAERENTRVNAELQGWLREIDAIWAGYEKDINDIARGAHYDDGDGKQISQYQRYGAYPLATPGAAGLTSGIADRVIPWFTLAVGVLLVLGLFTRVAAVGGSVFLLSVVASQPPFVPAASDTNYQIVLMLSLLVVAAVGAGRWGGLDFFLRLCWGKCCGNANVASED